MTKEQIAELEEGGSLMLCDDPWAKPLLRLLEERKRLLEGVKRLTARAEEHVRWPASLGPWCDGETDVTMGENGLEPGSCEDGESLTAARGAIAFAEAPAD